MIGLKRMFPGIRGIPSPEEDLKSSLAPEDGLVFVLEPFMAMHFDCSRILEAHYKVMGVDPEFLE